jgi:hypothetical protein
LGTFSKIYRERRLDMMIKVVNLKDFVVHKYMHLVKVDRSTVLGNPYKIGIDGNRTEVIAQYRQWLWGYVEDRHKIVWGALSQLYEDWEKHGILYLGCWCKPKACHADVIKSCLEWMKGGE